jgi:hypothetical protein
MDTLWEEFRQDVQKKNEGSQPGKMDILSEEFRQDVKKIKRAVTLRKLTFQQDVLKNYEATTVGRGLKGSDATFEYLASMHTLDEHVTLCARQC